ncbi:Ig-like domain-containing protein [Wukongibacter sp. M2B1]|uniref:Ig-like domain-containing protein n=1 Tax=Wukongibacter sp. M2B1 TaxID=3088895 RepID=UPI003D7B01BD
MKKRILSLLLIFSMIFSFMPMFDGNVYAANSGDEIRVRIEGKTGVLFDDIITITDEESGEDLLRTAIGDEEIDGEVSQYGLLINGLLGETAGESGEGYTTSWGLYVSNGGELKSSGVGISSLQLEGLEELLLHIKAYEPSTYEDLTFIPRLEMTQEGAYTKLTAKKVVTTYDENWNPVTSEEIVDGASLEIEGNIYTTDENGEVKVELEEGNYDVNISKEGKDYPELVRETYEITVEEHNPYEGKEIRVRIEGQNDTLFDDMITVTDEESGEDLLRTAIGDEEIDGEVSQYGLLINGLLGETAGESGEGYTTSWGLYVSNDGMLESSEVGISSLQLEGLEELLLHIKAYEPSTYADLTFIPRLEMIQEGAYTKLTAKKVVTTYDENWNPVISEEMVEGAKLEIEGNIYATDENGEVKVELEEGSYDVYVSKEGKNYPELVRETYEIIVEYSKFDEDDNNYDLWQSENIDVKSNKTWNIVFNMEIMEDSLQDSIMVVDSERNIVTGEVKVDSDNKTVKVMAPQNVYDAGATYTLYIKKEIQSIDGKTLKRSLRMPFTIAE